MMGDCIKVAIVLKGLWLCNDIDYIGDLTKYQLVNGKSI